uniref:Uncharacterized protein n=1 Tax=Ananas comosus var. bracteatus TaxID=296719 RepID=A0A6V7QM39_ANACO|nr:unnamed protein product [Ananas comosus var. bracteatus]
MGTKCEIPGVQLWRLVGSSGECRDKSESRWRQIDVKRAPCDARAVLAKKICNLLFFCLLYRYSHRDVPVHYTVYAHTALRLASCTGTRPRVPVHQGRLGRGLIGVRRRRRAAGSFEHAFDAGALRGDRASVRLRSVIKLYCRSIFETSTPGSLEYIYTRAGSPRGFYRVVQAVPDCRVPLRACLSSTEIRYILGWVAPTSATPESGFVLLRWCRLCQLDLLSTDQLVWIEPDSCNGAGTGVFTVPGTVVTYVFAEPQVSAAAPSADQDRGKGVAS